jgi:hypothetical protein
MYERTPQTNLYKIIEQSGNDMKGECKPTEYQNGLQHTNKFGTTAEEMT